MPSWDRESGLGTEGRGLAGAGRGNASKTAGGKDEGRLIGLFRKAGSLESLPALGLTDLAGTSFPAPAFRAFRELSWILSGLLEGPLCSWLLDLKASASAGVLLEAETEQRH